MSNIEEIFKNSLKDIEAPYDAKAWEAMSKRLDQHLPVKSVKTSFKWAWVASSILIVGVASFFGDSLSALSWECSLVAEECSFSPSRLTI